MGQFDGRVVIVTGSSNGIGRATAQRFAREGAMLTIQPESMLRRRGLSPCKNLAAVSEAHQES
ncbi:hypothetical protein ANCDUO_16023 [Ancylostoma duodenale]|uniref:Oxidoreductase, short chain dehydrogenase/reductase family protein n=1 Tax=Ancylostoma duodenale TaxID=51022 RepID=A0A0C2FYY4_9BILA|nr:hypothetical protein ANCDUO_16023 [Ancylostoma duodenale]